MSRAKPEIVLQSGIVEASMLPGLTLRASTMTSKICVYASHNPDEISNYLNH